MSRDVLTATPDMTEWAARMIHDNKIGALPVVKDDKLVGIITSTDLMEVLLVALGMSDDSARVSILARNRIGVLADVGRIMQQAEVNIRSVVTAPLQGVDDVWQMILRVNAAAQTKAVQVLRDAGFKVITEYVEDLTPFLPN